MVGKPSFEADGEVIVDVSWGHLQAMITPGGTVRGEGKSSVIYQEHFESLNRKAREANDREAETEKQTIFSHLTPCLRGYKVHQYLFLLHFRS